jgi:hypothetical protein
MRRASASTFQSAVGTAYLFFLVAFAVTATHLALFIDIAHYDGIAFLLQARSIIDDSVREWYFMRPRTPVMIVTLFNLAHQFLIGNEPSLHTYHLMMVAWSISFVVIWTVVVAKLMGRLVAYVAGIFLLSQQLLLHYSPFLLFEIVAGFFVGLLLWIFLLALEALSSPEQRKRTVAVTVALGAVGAMASLTKHHFSVLVPALLFSFLFGHWCFRALRGTHWGTEKQLGVWILGICIVWFVCFDAITSTFSPEGKNSFVQHFQHLFQYFFREGQVVAHRGNEPKLYIQNLLRMDGRLFWGLSLFSLLSMATLRRCRSEVLARSPTARMGLWCLAVLTLMYLTVLQLLPHREFRYIIPQVPGLLAFIAFGAVVFGAKLGGPAKAAWVTLWMVALVHPIQRTVADARVFYTDRIYSAKASNSEGYWDYFSKPTILGNSCETIFACGLFLRPLTRSPMLRDEFYQKYTLVPHYRYYTRLPTPFVKFVKCDPRKDYDETLSEMMASQDRPMHTCYAILESADELGSPGKRVPQWPRLGSKLPYVIVMKPLGESFSAEDTKKLAPLYRKDSPDRIHCQAMEEERDACFEYRKFFGR